MNIQMMAAQFWQKMKTDRRYMIGGIAGILFILLVLASIISTVFNPNISLVGMSPTGIVETKTNLTFTLSAAAIPPSDVGETIVQELVKFTPSIPGRFRWISQRELRFLPEAPLRPSNRYIAELQPRLIKLKDGYLSGRRNVIFTTPQIKVENVNTNFEYAGDQKKGLVLQANIRFNYPVAAAELEKSLRIKFGGWGRDIRFNAYGSETSDSFTITSEPLHPENLDRQIQINLPKDFRPVGGNIGLAQSFTYTATLGAKKPLQIIEANAKTDAARCWIAVRCSEPADARLIANFVRIEPKVAFRADTDGEFIYLKSKKFRPGETYSIRLATGLPSLNGLPLQREYGANFTFDDLEPSLRFNSPGRYLSSRGYLNLGLEAVNINKINIEISQIYANNIVTYLHNLNDEGYYYEGGISQIGKVVKSTVFRVDAPRNGVVTIPINLREYMNTNFRGIFQIVAYDDDNRWRQDYKYVIVTDLGILAKMGEDEMVVWANSLETLQPKGGVRVSLISYNNQTLATESTDGQGIAHFRGVKKATSGFEPFIILAEYEDDFSFVQLENGQISNSDFDVRGRPHLEDGYEAYLYMDRDIFRPGDKNNLVTVVRGPNASMPPEFPVTLEIRQPDGEIFKELKGSTGSWGACEFNIVIPDYAQTGRYQASLFAGGQPIGSASFSVEDFMPERIKVATILERSQYNAGENSTIKVTGMNLFGPPATGRRARLRVRLEAAPFDPPGYTSYSFGDPGNTFKAKELELGEGELDVNGAASFAFTFPKDILPPAKLKAIFQGTVIEDGGRAVNSYKAVDFHPYPRYIGVKTTATVNQPGRPYQLKYIVLDSKGQPVAADLTIEVFQITWNSLYRRNEDGRFEYVSEEERESVVKKNIAGRKGEQSFQFTPNDYGKYVIVIKDPKSSSKTSLDFYVYGWGYTPWSMEEPEKIKLEPERATYKVGETAQVRVKAPFSGRALVTVERGKIYSTQVVEFKENTGTINIPIREEYKPNVYISMHLIRSIKSLEKKAPGRAYGTTPLMVDCSGHRMDLGLIVPAEIKPNREIEVLVNVGQTSGSTYLTLAAVDEGICQLTEYNGPDPNGYFYGKRSLEITSYDLYGMLLPEVEPVKPKGAPGGDGLDAVRKSNLNPIAVKRVKPVSLWSGLVKVEAGQARIKLKVPQFNGTLRLMAVAFSGNNFGSVQRKVIVRDPIVISPTLPRFLASRDLWEVPVGIFNGTGRSGEFVVSIKATGPVELLSAAQQRLVLRNQEEKQVIFKYRAKNAVGPLNFRIQVRGNQQLCEVSEELPLRPSVPLINEIQSGAITAQKPLIFNPNTKWAPGTARYQLTISALPALKWAGSLEYLLGYPHGCIEQTTSKVFPLLYFDELAKALHHPAFKGGNADYFINEGIAKLEAMQMGSGGFAYWPGGSYGHDWSSVYAAHFLVEARKAGYTVSDRVYNRMLEYLITQVQVAEKSQYGMEIRVYALYVLSLAGKPQLSALSYLKNQGLENLSNYSRAQLAAAYYYAGDRKTARELLPSGFTATSKRRESGGNFNSPIRAEAIILSAFADIDPSNPAVFKLYSRLAGNAKPGYWGTTQENAFALMAIGKILARKSDANYQGEVWTGKNRIASFSNTKDLYLDDTLLAKGPIAIRMTGRGECYYFLQASGVPLTTDIKEYDRGIAIRREFLNRNGSPLLSSQFRQGDFIIVRLTLRTMEENLRNIAIVDLLPAGLEIENPRIASQAGFSWMEQSSIIPNYMDIRDDRIVFFVSPESQGTYQLFYAVRAVSCGEFILPSIKAECMYDPEISSFASSGQIVVKR